MITINDKNIMTHLEIAISQLGIEEVPKGSNWGPDVQKYLNSVGINFAASWCAAFVYWCCKQADPNTSLFKTGGVLNMWNQCKPELKHANPAIGDIFIMDFGHGLGHTGFIENIIGDELHTIEANSNNNGSREGYEVCRHIRHAHQMKGYIRV